MIDIIDVISADCQHIMCWATRLGESRHSDDPALAVTWQTLSALIILHLAADDEICIPAVLGPALAAQARGDHEDLREALAETGLQPPGSPLWQKLSTAALSAWVCQLDGDENGPVAASRRAVAPALRERLARQWRAFTEARIRDLYPQPALPVPTCQLRNDHAPAAVPWLADPAYAPLACTCPDCTLILDWTFSQPPGRHRRRPATPFPGQPLTGPESLREILGDGQGWAWRAHAGLLRRLRDRQRAVPSWVPGLLWRRPGLPRRPPRGA